MKHSEIKTEVPIFDYEDKTEVAIKQNISIGQIFPKGWNEIYMSIGLENLGVSSLSGGKQKAKAKETVLQYADFKNDIDGKRPLKCTDMYETPHFLPEKEDGRGKGGFYIDRIIPILLYNLSNSDRCVINTNISIA